MKRFTVQRWCMNHNWDMMAVARNKKLYHIISKGLKEV